MMNCTEFTEMIASRMPLSSEDTQSKATCLLLHIITLKFSFNQVNLEKVRYGRGESFIADIVRRRTLVWKLGQAFNVVVDQPFQVRDVPRGLETLAKKHNIDIEAIKARRKTIGEAIEELCTILTFMEVAQTIYFSLQYSDLQTLERGYQGHCHPSYTKPKRSLLTLLSKPANQSGDLLCLPASKLPGARPRTQIVLEKAKFPTHPRLRTGSQSSGSTVAGTNTSSSSLPRRMTRMPSNNSSVRSCSAQQRPQFAVYAIPVPGPVCRTQTIKRENGECQKVERVCAPVLYTPRMARQ